MIKLLIDSSSDIDQEEADELGVTMLPIQVRFGDDEYLDGVNLSHRRFFELLIESDELPKTSQINEFRYEEAFSKLTQNGDDVIAILLSSKLSGSYNCAVTAAKKFNGKVRVIDSLNACVGERILCQYALKLIKENTPIDEIVSKLEENKKKIKLLAMLDTLKYLKKGGRISAMVALTGEVFNIKPVVSVENGEVKLVGKAIGSKKGNNLLKQLVKNCGGIDFSMPYVVAYSGLSDELLKKYLEDSRELWESNADEIPQVMIGSTIGTHVGPGAIAVCFFSND